MEHHQNQEHHHHHHHHHIHVWAISTTETALTAHVVIDNLRCWPQVSERIKHTLADHGISHVTLEPETVEHQCQDKEC